MPIRSIILAINNPPAELVRRWTQSLLGDGWRVVWCADVASLSQLPPANGEIRYVVVGTSGSLKMADVRPHFDHDLRDVCASGPGARAFGFYAR